MIKLFQLTLLDWINTYNTLVIPASDNQHELVNLSFYRVLEIFQKRKCLNFHEMLSKKHTSSLKQKRIEIHTP